jgi:hypothetical protein
MLIRRPFKDRHQEIPDALIRNFLMSKFQLFLRQFHESPELHGISHLIPYDMSTEYFGRFSHTITSSFITYSSPSRLSPITNLICLPNPEASIIPLGRLPSEELPVTGLTELYQGL